MDERIWNTDIELVATHTHIYTYTIHFAETSSLAFVRKYRQFLNLAASLDVVTLGNGQSIAPTRTQRRATSTAATTTRVRSTSKEQGRTPSTVAMSYVTSFASANTSESIFPLRSRKSRAGRSPKGGVLPTCMSCVEACQKSASSSSVEPKSGRPLTGAVGMTSTIVSPPPRFWMLAILDAKQRNWEVPCLDLEHKPQMLYSTPFRSLCLDNAIVRGRENVEYTLLP